MNALISAIFPLMAVSSGAYPFVFFSIMMVGQFFVVLFVYPETKGYSLEEMQRRITSPHLKPAVPHPIQQ
jgi:hypothetical protein